MLAPKRKSNVPMIAGGVVLILLAAAVGAALFSGATARTEVLTIGRDLEPGHVVTADDLGVTSMAGGAGIEVIAAVDRDSVVGRTVTAPLPAGSIVHPGFFDNDTAIVRQRSVHVGAELAPGEFPSADLRAGTQVTLYLIAEGVDSGAGVEEIAAEIVSADGSTGSGNKLLVTFSVDESDAGRIEAAAAANNLRFGTVETRTVDALGDGQVPEETPTADEAEATTEESDPETEADDTEAGEPR